MCREYRRTAEIQSIGNSLLKVVIFSLTADMSQYLTGNQEAADPRCFSQCNLTLKSRTSAVFRASTRHTQSTPDTPGGYLWISNSCEESAPSVPHPLGAVPVGFFYNCCLSSTNGIGISEVMAEGRRDKHALKKGTAGLTTVWKAPYKRGSAQKWGYFIY